MIYKFQGSDCDVQDKTKLERYRAKRELWLDWLASEETNSIDNQLHNLMWWDAVFWMLNEARGYASADRPTAAISPVLAEFIDQGYLALQVLSIGKLVEENRGDTRGVISLKGLIDDLIDNADLFTREIYVGYDGNPFDPAPARQRFIEASSGTSGHLVSPAMQGPDAWHMPELMHQKFDKLSRVGKSHRSRNDMISDKVFDALRGALDRESFVHILDLRNKLFAHAADARSRALAKTSIQGVQLRAIRDSQKTLLQLSQTIGAGILWGPNLISAVAIPQFNHFSNLDQPFLPEGKFCQLREFWDRRCKESSMWLETAFKEILPLQ